MNDLNGNIITACMHKRIIFVHRSADTKIYNVVQTVKTLHPQAAPKAEPKLGSQQADQKIRARARGMIHSARNVTSDLTGHKRGRARKRQ